MYDYENKKRLSEIIEGVGIMSRLDFIDLPIKEFNKYLKENFKECYPCKKRNLKTS